MWRTLQILYQAPDAPGGGGAPTAPTAAPSSAPSAPTPAAPSRAAPEPTSKVQDNADGSSPFSLPDSVFGPGGMDDDVVDHPAPAAPPTPAAPKPTDQPQPAVVPPAAVPPADVQPTTAAPTAPGPQEAPQAPAPAVPAFSPAEPGKLASSLRESMPAMIEHLAATEFALSAEDNQALDADAAGHIPKLLARVAMWSQVNMLNMMQKSVPAMMQHFNQVTDRRRASEDAFYGKWKDAGIDRTKHHDLVTKFAVAYRQANPSATMAQMIEDVGPMVMVAAKIGAPTNGAAAGAPALAPGAQAPALVPSPQPTRSMPFVPAASGGPGAGPGSPPASPWDGLGGDYDNEAD